MSDEARELHRRISDSVRDMLSAYRIQAQGGPVTAGGSGDATLPGWWPRLRSARHQDGPAAAERDGEHTTVGRT